MVQRSTPPGKDRQDDEQLIARLYRNGVAVPPDRFRVWALEQLRECIPFDQAIWGGGNGLDWKFNFAALINLPPEFARLLETTRPINPIAGSLLTQLDRPHRMQDVCTDAEFFQSEVYRTVFQPQGISRIMSTVSRNPRSGIYSMLGLYRKDRAKVFTDEEKARHQRIAFHLQQSLSHNYFAHLALRSVAGPAKGATAVVDRRGHFHEVQPQFLELLKQHPPAFVPGKLPFDLPAPGLVKRIGTLSVRSEALGDLLCVHLWPSGPLDKLTPRERLVADAISRGLSFKEAARLIGLAPSTVANHLYRIYRKLSLSGRHQLAELLHPLPPSGEKSGGDPEKQSPA